jgi:hypothetical protein
MKRLKIRLKDLKSKYNYFTFIYNTYIKICLAIIGKSDVYCAYVKMPLFINTIAYSIYTAYII